MRDLPAVPVLLALASSIALSVLTGRWEIVAGVASSSAAFALAILCSVAYSAERSRPLSERNLQFQSLSRFFRALQAAALLLIGGVLGAAIAIGLQPPAGRPVDPDWLSAVVGPTLATATVVGAVGLGATLVRGVLGLSRQQRCEALRNTLAAIASRDLVPIERLPRPEGPGLRHLTSNWYLLWLPLMAVLGFGSWATLATL